jgi:hypothetical protein
MIHKDEFAAIRVRFFQWRELAGFGTKRFVCGEGGGREQQDTKAQLVKELG